jgi:Leucine-rich repeat (LRR) protein
LKKGDGKKKQQKQPLQMGNLRIDRIIYPVKTKRGIKHAP